MPATRNQLLVLGTQMGAIEPILSENVNDRDFAANKMKLKSASIGASNQPFAQALQIQYELFNNSDVGRGGGNNQLSPVSMESAPGIIIGQVEDMGGAEVEEEEQRNQREQQTKLPDSNGGGAKRTTLGSNGNKESGSSSLQAKARKLLSLSPGSVGSPLKPSVSTSCLLTAEDQSTGSNNLVCVPTRASLTHEWKRLKTPNKCRECNLLVYFNGRECAFCGFVAHKKCVTVLVIKCSDQRVARASGAAKNQKCAQQQQVNQTSNSKSSSNSNQIAQSPATSYNDNELDCEDDNLIVQPIFGQAIHGVKNSNQIIDFMRRFIYEIDSRGLTSKGIYRVSSIKSKVDKLCNYYDQNLSSLVDLSSFHPNIIANALKMYLRQLPEPLLTYKLYSDFIEIAKKYPSNSSSTSSPTYRDKSQATMFRFDNNNINNDAQAADSNGPPNKQQQSNPRRLFLTLNSSNSTSITNNPNYDPMLIVELREIIDSLPPINRQLIAIIMRHLKRVADMSAENQMSALNLSIIFGPTLLNAQDNKSLAIVDNIHQARVVELMITWAEQIFPQYANYESKAVIELNLSEQYYNKLQQQQQHEDETKTRQDLKESRRKFFTNTAPVQTTKLVLPSAPASMQSKSQQVNEERAANANVKAIAPAEFDCAQQQQQPQPQQFDCRTRKLCSFNPPGSVPVIKVQPCFCNTLSKLNKIASVKKH